MDSIAIVTTLANSPMLDRCIRSILESDYPGEILVTSCYPEAGAVTTISPRVRFSYQPGDGINNPRWGLLGNCISSLGEDYHDLITIHSDTIVPPIWYDKLCEAWALCEDNAWVISLPHITHVKYHTNTEYNECIYSNSYKDIVNKYGSIEESYPICTNNTNQLLGLGIDMWHRNYTGRLSPCSSIHHRVYREAIEKYGGENYFVMELLMLNAMIKERRWCPWVNTLPTIHYVGYDTTLYPQEVYYGHKACYEKWYSIFGYNLEHLITIWSGIVTVEHRVEITNAINEGKWKDVEYLFGEVEKLLACRDCNMCRRVSDTDRCRGKVNIAGWS